MTGVTAVGAARYAGARVHRVEDARLLTGRGTYVDDISLPGMLHACFVRSPFARAAIRGIDTSAALRAARRARRLHRRRPQPGRQGAVAHVGRAAESRDAAAPAGRGRGRASSATRSPSWWPRAATWPRTPPSWSRSTTSRCRPSSTTPSAEQAESLVHESHGSNLIGEMAGLARRCPRGGVRLRRPRGRRETIYQQAYAAGADGRPGACRRLLAAPRASSPSTPRRSRRTRSACSAPGCSACPSTASGWSCATRAVASDRRSWCSATRCA